VNPTVGVVIAAYQAERWLPMTLRSLQQQTLTDWVCIIVDDGSTDTTGDIADTAARTDPRITVIHQSNHGVTSSRNAGIAALPDVEHVAFLDSDDLYLPTTLHTLVTALAARPDAVGAYGLAEYIDATGARIDPGKHPAVQRTRRRYDGGRWRGHLTDVAPTDDLTLAELVVANPFWPPATGLVRHSALRATGPFDQTYQVQEDWQLWLRLATHGPLLALDTPTAEYRRHDTNLTGDDMTNVVTQARIRHEAGRGPGAAVAAGAWRKLQHHRLLHHASLASRGLRGADPRQVTLAGSVLLLLLPDVLRRSAPRPGRRLALARRLERRADLRSTG
jgi:GT2 family glycosyltransferase